MSYGPFPTLVNCFRSISFQKISVLDSYFIQLYNPKIKVRVKPQIIMRVMALFQLFNFIFFLFFLSFLFFAKCLCLGEDGPWAGASVLY